MSAAGARARETAPSAEAAEQSAPPAAAHPIERVPGQRTRRAGRRTFAVAVVVVLAVAGGVAYAAVSVGQGNARSGHAEAGPAKAVPARPSAKPSKAAAPTSAAPTSAAPTPTARRSAATAVTAVVGPGCPNGGGRVIPYNAATGPGWMPATGGWTGNGCNGSTLWTMNPNGNQPANSVLTWEFGPLPGVKQCTLAVFIPTQNALGETDYSVSADVVAMAAVLVDQGAEEGSWFSLGTFAASGAPPEITAEPVPGASGKGHHSAVAASAARATCT